jgi:hypothetical protein
MNRKQKRRLRKHANRERYLVNRRRWCPVGPPVVLDEPTEEHVKGLLMLWLGPRAVLDEVAKEVSKVQADSMESQLYDFMAKLAGPIEIEALPKDELWRHLLHGALTNNPAIPFKIAPA